MTRQRRFRHGTVYCLRVHRAGRWRIVRGYIGQTRYRDYRKRVHQHLYGHWYNGEWNPPKYWAHEVIDYYPMWSGEHWSDWGLDTREFLCIRVFFPIHNVLLNLGNPRRVIPPPRDMRVYPTPDQITAVERYPTGAPLRPAVPQWPTDHHPVTRGGLIQSPRVFSGSFLVKWVALAAVLMMFIPGLPGWDVASNGVEWGLGHRGELGGALVLAGVAWWVTTLKPKRRRRTSSTRTRSRLKRRTPFL